MPRSAASAPATHPLSVGWRDDWLTKDCSRLSGTMSGGSRTLVPPPLLA
ncbi:MAG: hypothetical protein R3B90_21985 [Planctomycetaceae bacterium]